VEFFGICGVGGVGLGGRPAEKKTWEKAASCPLRSQKADPHTKSGVSIRVMVDRVLPQRRCRYALPPGATYSK
jgi:hypothetical protein